jgi:hypothetical protein
MTIPIELLIWGLTGLTAIGGGALHLLIRINGRVGDICRAHELAQSETKMRIDQLDRHERRNEQEIAQLRRHLNLPFQPHHGDQRA